VGVATRENFSFVSGLGFSLGYLGGGLLFALNVLMALNPTFFGLSEPSHAVRFSFLTVSVWWAVFSIPILIFVNEPENGSERVGRRCVFEGFRQLRNTFQEARRLKVVFLFLLGYWLYIDGVYTIIKMAIDYGLSLGLNSQSLIVALLITQFVGFPAALFMGKAGDWIGTKNAILLCLLVYAGVTAYSFFMSTATEFYALAVAIGLVQGGVQSLSRSLYAKLIPEYKSAQFFGLYNMMGKFAAILGPFMVGWVGLMTKNPRYGILSIIVLFAGGGLLLYLVDEKEGRRMTE
ncbi:MAG: MFS transporter, partial [Candidatus Caldarchaeum sp.]